MSDREAGFILLAVGLVTMGVFGFPLIGSVIVLVGVGVIVGGN